MSEREEELRRRWRDERQMYDAWGALVTGALSDDVGEAVKPVSVEVFFRIPPKHRTKEEASLLAKAFHRGKPYTDPYAEIEDKVGVRFVVLFSEDIRIVENAIKSSNRWTAALARDFAKERDENPYEFNYQSLHYIVRANEGLSYQGIEIAPGSPCEVQVRTILQHAYSELTHDTIYKPSVQAAPSVKRAAAKSMALIEATEDYFSQVKYTISLSDKSAPDLIIFLNEAYISMVKRDPDSSPLNIIIIDYLKKWATENIKYELEKFYDDKSFLLDNIRERSATHLVYRQPAVLLLYFAISKSPREVADFGPLSEGELAPLYSDLGTRVPSARL